MTIIKIELMYLNLFSIKLLQCCEVSLEIMQKA
jgi:hypothetical protein